LNPTSAGEIGELWLGGPCVGLGYINNPEETARRFCQDPLASGYRSVMYRTGDLVQEDPRTGVLSFRGRADNQIKLSGHRIELEEIDHALQSIPGVDRALAIAIHGSGGAVRLMAAYSGRRLDNSELLAHCRDRLPAYMTPSRFAWLDAMPTNANGKADRRAVAALVAEGRLTPVPN
jgi:D-alanine--poly(phosphoribitol) ligase subunit 1